LQGNSSFQRSYRGEYTGLLIYPSNVEESHPVLLFICLFPEIPAFLNQLSVQELFQVQGVRRNIKM
jgi:hypothetical protein